MFFQQTAVAESLVYFVTLGLQQTAHGQIFRAAVKSFEAVIGNAQLCALLAVLAHRHNGCEQQNEMKLVRVQLYDNLTARDGTLTPVRILAVRLP